MERTFAGVLVLDVMETLLGHALHFMFVSYLTQWR